MKVLLVCMSGITTSFLARRLHAYSEEIGAEDEFIPCRIGSSSAYLVDVDVVLLAPQAESFYQALLEENQQLKNVVILDEKMFVSGKIEDIYKYIKQNDKSRNHQSIATIHLTLNMLLEILFDATIKCIPIVLFGLFGYFTFSLFHFSVGLILFESMIGFYNVYLAYSIGAHYGHKVENHPHVIGVVTFITTMMLNYSFQSEINVYANLTYESIFSILMMILERTIVIVFFSILTIVLLEASKKARLC